MKGLAGIALCALTSLLPFRVAHADGHRLQGHWRTDCLPMGAGGRHGAITTVTFRGDEIRAVLVMHTGAGCELPSVTAEYTGRFRIVGEPEGALAIDHVVSSLTMTVGRADVAEHYNRGRR
ncbi:hypothetical protein [Azospirillum sp. TSO22-1]|uniref:hypothetical protein n=1 Tax=Azospirillum sp. TSO22-1 TaxID=716789 RepID=UPI0011B81925|nr:hypothetical protein [Azospirillum sp. TSO22-1]